LLGSNPAFLLQHKRSFTLSFSSDLSQKKKKRPWYSNVSIAK